MAHDLKIRRINASLSDLRARMEMLKQAHSQNLPNRNRSSGWATDVHAMSQHGYGHPPDAHRDAHGDVPGGNRYGTSGR